MSSFNIKKLIFLLIFFSFSCIEARVREVTITWNAPLCLSSCVAGLYDQFMKIPGVEEVDMAPGRARLKWQPDAPFSFVPINTAMSMIGLSIIELRVKVSGAIIHNANSVTLVSKPDGTWFNLRSTPIPVPNQYVEQFNISNYSLHPQMYQELLEAEEKQQEVEITGQIFEPERSPPLVLIIERKQLAKPQ